MEINIIKESNSIEKHCKLLSFTYLPISLFQIFCQVGGKMKGFFVEPNTGLVCIIKKAGLVSIFHSDLCFMYIELTANVFNSTEI